MRMRTETAGIVADLFPLYMSRPDLMPENWREAVAGAEDETGLARLVSDYVSGMTDRYAIREWERLVGAPA